MPDKHLDAYYMQCSEDVGGTDFWQSSWYDDDQQWWVGFHTLKPFKDFHLSQKYDWALIGYELWPYNRDGWLQEAYYAHPNPSTTPAYVKVGDYGDYMPSNLTPQGHYHIMFNPAGKRTCNTIWCNMI